MSSLAVFDIEHGTASSVRSLEDHSVNRTEDGWSAIDTSRSHLNRTLVGANGPSASLKAWYERTEARRPTAQAETPYYQLVLSASPEHLADPKKLLKWEEAAIQFLKDELADDLVWAAIHLDETTAHIHALAAPTYERMKRKPGLKKRGETDEEFEARKLSAAAAPGVRTVSRTKHKWAGRGSYDALRERYCAATGLDYGQRGMIEDPKTTREWIKGRVKFFNDAAVQISAALARLKRKDERLSSRESAVTNREKAVTLREAEIAAGLVEVRQLYNQILDVGPALKRGILLDSLRPTVRVKVEKTLEEVANILAVVDRNIIKTSVTLNHAKNYDVSPVIHI